MALICSSIIRYDLLLLPKEAQHIKTYQGTIKCKTHQSTHPLHLHPPNTLFFDTLGGSEPITSTRKPVWYPPGKRTSRRRLINSTLGEKKNKNISEKHRPGSRKSYKTRKKGKKHPAKKKKKSPIPFT